MIIPNSSIDNIVFNLVQNGGVATLSLPDDIAAINKRAFNIATIALDKASAASNGEHEVIPRIKENSNSALVTGYHSAGGSDSLSRYNTFREGFIFSNGEIFDIQLDIVSEKGNHEDVSFEEAMGELFKNLCGIIARSTLKGIARYLRLEDEDWFDNAFGPMENSSQWHVKRYVEPSFSNKGEEQIDIKETDNAETAEDEVFEWLPVHTDPSLISVIIHDAPGYNKHAMGLQYQCPQSLQQQSDRDSDGSQKKTRIWKEVEAHGHSVATIFCGSVLSYITGGLFPSAKHRVIYNKSNQSPQDMMEGVELSKKFRQAATLFLRPQGKSILTIPPSPRLTEREVKIRKGLQFVDWLNRVSKNYQHKQNQKEKVEKKGKESNVQNNDQAKNTHISDPVYWADEHTELTLHGANPPLVGREKYLGGELCEMNGHIYTIPGFAGRVIDMDVTVEPPRLSLIGPELKGEYKWLRGIPLNNCIYGIPCHADSVLKINALTNEITELKWDEALPRAAPHHQKWKYHGAAVSDIDGCIYCIPQAAEHVLKFNPKTEEFEFIGPQFKGVNKWYGGLLLRDGAIYGVCQNATGILRIDPSTQQCTIHGSFPEGHYKWHGGVHHTNGYLYCIPAHADRVLKVEPGLEPKLTIIGDNLRTGEHRSDGKYKFLGGAVGGDCVYFFPSDSDYVVEVNTKTDEVREVGPNLRNFESMRNNKWQNGFTAVDGSIYGIPLKGSTVLRIIPSPEEGGEPDITTIGGPYAGLNKWEGGVTAANGDMYCVPLNHKFSLRIRPLKKG